MEITIPAESFAEAGLVQANDGLVVMSPVVVLLTGEELPCDVELTLEVRDGSVECTALQLREKEGVPIDAETLRALPFARLLGVAASFATPPDAEDIAARRRSFEKRDAISRALTGRRRITRGLLERVAETYRNAEDWPTKAVATAENVSRSTAAKYVHAAREAGLLPEAENKGPNWRGEQ